VRKLAQLQDNLGCVDLVLSPDRLQRLNEVSQIELVFPHDFLSGKTIRDRLFGDSLESIDNPRQLADRA
jgi:hypothetical protein